MLAEMRKGAVVRAEAGLVYLGLNAEQNRLMEDVRAVSANLFSSPLPCADLWKLSVCVR